MKDLNQYWASHPPVHLMVASYLGIKPAAKERATPQNLRELAAKFGLGVRDE